MGGEDDMVEYFCFAIFQVQPHSAIIIIGKVSHGRFEEKMIWGEAPHDGIDV